MAPEENQTSGKDLSGEKFSIADLESGLCVFRFASSYIGISSRKQFCHLCLAILIPIFVFGIVTSIEDRLLYKHVKTPLNKYIDDNHGIHQVFIVIPEGYKDVLGMSFLGDTSVWPYIFLVPLFLLLTKYAVTSSVTLLNQVRRQVSDAWKNDETEFGYNATVKTTRDIFNLQYNRWSKVLNYAPWILAIAFWICNTTTCAFYDKLGWDFYPYKSDKVIMLPINDSKGIPSTVANLNKKINLPKWDCDRKSAPLSCYATRIWTIFFYGLPPFLLSQLITIVWGVTAFLMGARRWDRQKKADNTKSAIDIKPFADDGFGGLGDISKTGESYFFVFTAFILLVTSSLFKEGTPPSWYNYIFIALLIPLAIVAFLTPTFAIRQSIIGAKRSHLFVVSEKINKIYSIFLDKIHEPSSLEMIKLHYQLLSLKSFYEQIRSLPEWPFTTSTFFRIGFSASLPFLVARIEVLLKSL